MAHFYEIGTTTWASSKHHSLNHPFTTHHSSTHGLRFFSERYKVPRHYYMASSQAIKPSTRPSLQLPKKQIRYWTLITFQLHLVADLSIISCSEMPICSSSISMLRGNSCNSRLLRLIMATVLTTQIAMFVHIVYATLVNRFRQSIGYPINHIYQLSCTLWTWQKLSITVLFSHIMQVTIFIVVRGQYCTNWFNRWSVLCCRKSSHQQTTKCTSTAHMTRQWHRLLLR